MVINDYRNFVKTQNILELVFTVAFKEEISLKTIEQRIAKSAYFNALYLDEETSPIYISSEDIINDILYQKIFDKDDIIQTIDVVACWCAEIYTKIMSEFSFTFEAIFLYFPISKMIGCFNLYHEMDDSQILESFSSEVFKHSVLELAAKRYGITNREISTYTGLSESMVSLLKSKKKNINKLNVETCLKLSMILRINIRSLLCNK